MSDADYLTDFDPGWEQVDDGIEDWQGVGVLPFLEHLPFTAGGVVVVS